MLSVLVRRVIVLVVVSSSMLFIAGCGDSVSGLYTDDSGQFKFDFKSDGKVSVTLISDTKEATYTIKDKTVVVTVPPAVKRYRLRSATTARSAPSAGRASRSKRSDLADRRGERTPPRLGSVILH